MSAQSAGQIMNLSYQHDRAQDLMKQADEIGNTISILQQQLALQRQSSAATHEQTEAFHDTVATVTELRDKLANFDDQFRPIRNYFYWEPHCFDIPMCSALRSVFDSLDGISQLAEKFDTITASLDKLDALQPQLLALLPPQIAIQQRNRDLILSNFATTSGTNSQSEEALRNATAMGQAFDDAKNDDTFYLPPEAFDNPDFQRGLKLFLSPDGKAARMIITHQGVPASTEGISHIDALRDSAFDALKATPLSDAKIYVAGTAASYKDIQDGEKYDLIIAALAALALILLIMIFITRSLVAAAVIVGTVVLSLGASFGLSVLVWQYIFGIPLYWIVMALAIILLLAVGADYNLLLISRFQEEVDAGLRTGIIRAMGGTGRVVTAAGLVFAATMSSFIFSDLVVLGQIGTTIGLGLLFDTLIVRSFMTPSIAAMLGRWFWWPLIVRPRPASRMLGPTARGPRSASCCTRGRLAGRDAGVDLTRSPDLQQHPQTVGIGGQVLLEHRPADVLGRRERDQQRVQTGERHAVEHDVDLGGDLSAVAGALQFLDHRDDHRVIGPLLGWRPAGREVQCEKVLEQPVAQSALQFHQHPQRLGKGVPNAVRPCEESVEFGGDALFLAPLQFEQDVFLGREVEEECSVRNPGRRHDGRGVGRRHTGSFELASAAPSSRSRLGPVAGTRGRLGRLGCDCLRHYGQGYTN
jgi:hypothetical protein